MLEGAELAKAIYDRQRDSDLARKRKRAGRIPTWEQLSASERSRLIRLASKCSRQYSRSTAREVPLIP